MSAEADRSQNAPEGASKAVGEDQTRTERTVSGQTGTDSTEGQEQIFHCDLCGAVMLNMHCKLICERCGYKRDCSDP